MHILQYAPQNKNKKQFARSSWNFTSLTVVFDSENYYSIYRRYENLVITNLLLWMEIWNMFEMAQ